MKTSLVALLFVTFSAFCSEVVVLHHGDPFPADGVVFRFENDDVRREFEKRFAERGYARSDAPAPAKAEVKEEPKKEEPKEKAKEPEKPKETPKADPPKKDERSDAYEMDSEGVIVLHKGQKIPTSNGPGVGPPFRYDSPETKAWFDAQEGAIASTWTEVPAEKERHSYRTTKMPSYYFSDSPIVCTSG